MSSTARPSPARRPALRRAALGAVATCLAAGGPPALARADTYGVVQCGDVRGVAGAAARDGAFPFRDAAGGFRPFGTAGVGTAQRTCADPGELPGPRGMQARLAGSLAQRADQHVGWRWDAPTGTEIVRYAARFSAVTRAMEYGSSGTGGAVSVRHEGQNDPTYDWRAIGAGTTPTRTLDVPVPAGARWVEFRASCNAAPRPAGPGLAGTCPPRGDRFIAGVNVNAIETVLEDDSAPQATRVSGELVSSESWRGPMGVSAQITDGGSGVYRFVVQRRGAGGAWGDVAAQVVHPNGGACAPVGGAGVLGQRRVFTHPQPCRTAASGDYDVNTASLPPGPGVFRILVEDVAGNRSTLLGAARRTVGTPPAPATSGPGGPPAAPPLVSGAQEQAAVPATAASEALLKCSKRSVLLTDVYPSGRRDVLRGVADARYVGRRVAVRYRASGRVVGRPTVGVDGTFGIVVRGARGKVARGNRARYQAFVDGRSSQALKRTRRMFSTEARRAGTGAVRLEGRAVRPLVRGARVTLQVRRDCRTWTTTRSTRLTRGGSWGGAVTARGTSPVAVVRARTTVRDARGRRAVRTYTLPSAVRVR